MLRTRWRAAPFIDQPKPFGPHDVQVLPASLQAKKTNNGLPTTKYSEDLQERP
ncbi:hypothetical protein RRSWK_06326 [Rhodopirellula sp. SWK7]|nr:hypothetical protein RRSWK_06326 [Rhodopirellula sp. SWK7]